jgi:endonuclease/exonuclease/phosphatase family metal-dependent hydrolase
MNFKSSLFLSTIFLIPFSVLSAEKQKVTFMTYNVENMFDAEHDEGKDDYTYLPLALKKGALKEQVKKSCKAQQNPTWRKECLELDWNEEVVTAKQRQIASVIKSIDGGSGVGPDIVLLEEVENLNVVQSLVDNELSDANYNVTLIEAGDPRGIDQAILSRYPLSEEFPPQLHAMKNYLNDFHADQISGRGILEATVVLPDNSLLTVLALHFPAPSHPAAKRENALMNLNAVRESIPANHLIVAGGDTNITREEVEQYDFLTKYMRPLWVLAEDYCSECVGTHFYAPKKDWSFLDRLFISHGAKGAKKVSEAWSLDPSGVRVMNIAEGQVNAEGEPIRFNPEALKNQGAWGMSDHLPLTMSITRN